MGIGPIPRSRIRDYATDELGLIGDAHERFCLIIQRVDDDYVSMANAPANKDGNKPLAADINDADAVLRVFGIVEAKNKHRQAVIRKDQHRV